MRTGDSAPVLISCLVGVSACSGKTNEVSKRAGEDGDRVTEPIASPKNQGVAVAEASPSDGGIVNTALMCVPEIPACAMGDFSCNTQRDSDGDGWWNHQDCDDSDDRAHPCAQELCCDGIDSDCDGHDDPAGVACRCASPSDAGLDSGASQDATPDDAATEDAAGQDAAVVPECTPEIPACAQGDVFVCNTQMDWDGDGWWNHQDCDDQDVDVHPCAVELCCDGIDRDCDGLLDPIGVDCDCP